ncbi:MAG TPA: type II secretion system protein [Blastocatellia bacterium]|nr:type II secretion system protein [Blastocatellia bacterium]
MCHEDSDKASAGFSLIELIIVIALIGIVTAIALPNLMTARRNAQEASGAAMVKSLIKAEGMYFSGPGNQASYGTLSDLVTTNCIDAALLTEARNYYTFQVNLTTPITYFVTATPGAELAAQMRHYYGDETGVVRVAMGTTATAASPPLN